MERRAITVRGVVQGVGFRPFVHRLASRLCLTGFVKNDRGDVLIEIEGERPSLDVFLSALARQPPALARIDSVESSPRPARGEPAFRIDPSALGAPGETCIAPDAATCAECLAELFDPADRRYRYPFLNCTHCGPRLTIIRGAPYDRERTTMAEFAMCLTCQAEYEDPGDRRFHAQPIACPCCGPKLDLRAANGERIDTANPLAAFIFELRQGRIGAMKGLGGFHLICDAGDAPAVAELRRRKHRDEQPFAVMFADLETAQRLCHVSEKEAELLTCELAPIVLLQRRNGIAAGEQAAYAAARPRQPVCEAVAPGSPYWGVLLPHTPLHHLLAKDFGRPLVMTSGNRRSEPVAFENGDALDRMAGIADIFLLHDRPIHVRCDDSVTRVVGGQESPVRRSRGYAPVPIKLPMHCPVPLLAVGGQMKGTFALACGNRAFLSHHLGDLENFQAYRSFEREVGLYQEIFGIRPRLIVHDLHPDYLTTRYAKERSSREGLPLLGVQHHHAHLAGCLAECGLDEPVIGVAFDGTGFGVGDGPAQPTVWGGEFFVGDYRTMRRGAHLRNVAMPGGEAAVREPWRMGLSHLIDAGLAGTLFADRLGTQAVRIAETMLSHAVNAPLTSSAGRLFDAVAAIAGLRDRVTYEGQAAIALEWLATDVATDVAYPFTLESVASIDPTAAQEIDTRPMIRAIFDDVVRGVDSRRIARRFHSTIVNLIAAVCLRLRDQTGLDVVVLSGGVFANALLLVEVDSRLTEAGFRVRRHRQVPPNDGGLCLGQVAVAAATWQGVDCRPDPERIVDEIKHANGNSLRRSW